MIEASPPSAPFHRKVLKPSSFQSYTINYWREIILLVLSLKENDEVLNFQKAKKLRIAFGNTIKYDAYLMIPLSSQLEKISSDVEIPPPRPKRKLSCSGPQKVGITPETSSKEPNGAAFTIAMTTSGQYLKLKCNPSHQQKTVEQTYNEGPEFLVQKNAPSASKFFSSSPIVKEVGDKVMHSESCQSDQENKEMQKSQVEHSDIKSSPQGSLRNLHKSQQERERKKESENSTPLLCNSPQTYLCSIEHAQEEPIDRKSMKQTRVSYSAKSFSISVMNQVEPKESTNLFMSPNSSVTQECHANSTFSSTDRMFPAYSPYSQFFSMEDAYRSMISSASSGLILSGLLQNSAVSAVTNFAASLWPSMNIKGGVESTSDTADGARKELNPCHGMATIAAASAWWATNGLIPLFPHLHPSYAFRPPLAVPAQTVTNVPTSEDDTRNKDGRLENLQLNKNQRFVC